MACDAQRDLTQFFDAYEKEAYEMARITILTLVHTISTLDDDLYGTRWKDNPVKNLSAPKADYEAKSANVICDSFFRIIPGISFRRRCTSQALNVNKLLDVVTEGRGEQSLHGMIVTAHRGYSGMPLIRSLHRHVTGSIAVLPKHLLRAHRF